MRTQRWLTALSVILFLTIVVAGYAFGYSGSCGIWATKRGDFYSKPYAGTQAGYDQAKSYVGTNGVIQIFPGCDDPSGVLTPINLGALNDSVLVLKYVGGRYEVYGTNITPRVGPFSTATTGGAVRIIDGATFPQNRTGVNAAVQEVIAAGGGLVLMPRGRYRWDLNVTLNNPKGVTIQGIGDSTALWGDFATGDDFFRMTGTGNDVTFRDFSIDGDRANNNAGRGIDDEVSTVRDVIVDNVTIQRTNDAAISSLGPRTIVRNCKISDPGDGVSDGYGVLLTGTACDSSRIEDNDIIGAKDQGIRVESGNDNVVVRGNRVLDSSQGALYFQGNGGKYGVVEGNYFSGSTNSMLAWIGGDSLRVMDNTFTNCKIYSGLYMLRGIGVVIANNICSFNVHHGIFVGFDNGDCKDVVITGNLCEGNQGSGIIVNPSTTRTFTNISIMGNTCINNTSYGVSTAAATNASTACVSDNFLWNNTAGNSSLSTSNWTYRPPQFDSGILVRGGSVGSILFDQAGVNQILATNATGDIGIGWRNSSNQLTLDGNGVTSTAHVTLSNTAILKIKDTGGTAQTVLHTAGGTNILRLSPLGSGQSIDVLSYAGVANVTFRDDGVFVMKSYTFASLPTATGKNGGILYCSDCKNVGDGGTAGAAAVSGGTGNMVIGCNGTWRAP